MTVFIFFVFGVYGGIHVYAFLKARQALGFGWGAGILLVLFMLLMVVAVFLIHALEDRGYELTARVFSYVAYLWMAVVFLFFCSSVFLDIVNLALRVPGWMGARASMIGPLPSRITFGITLSAALLITVYGYFDALNIRTEHLRIETAKLPKNIDRLRVVQISDVHLGFIMRCDRLVGILEKVKEAKPDVFVVTGDLVDAQINHLAGLRELLQDVQTPLGRFAVTGNHEYYAGIGKSVEFIRQCGLTLLRGEARDIGPIVIAGVDDRTAAQVHAEVPASDLSVLAKLDRSKFILFLKHQPHPDPDSIGMFDLMLSGHTHKGQIWPFTYVARSAHPLLAGRYDIGKGSVVYTSRGSGTWGPPVRFLASPEVTIIELVRAGGSGGG